MLKIGTCKIGGVKADIYDYNNKLEWVLVKKIKYHRYKKSGYTEEKMEWVTNSISDIKLYNAIRQAI